jgi:hypothetical protein
MKKGYCLSNKIKVKFEKLIKFYLLTFQSDNIFRTFQNGIKDQRYGTEAMLIKVSMHY